MLNFPEIHDGLYFLSFTILSIFEVCYVCERHDVRSSSFTKAGGFTKLISDARVKNSAQKRRVKQFDTCITFCKSRPLSETYENRPKVSFSHTHILTKIVKYLKDKNNQKSPPCISWKITFFLMWVNFTYYLFARYELKQKGMPQN